MSRVGLPGSRLPSQTYLLPGVSTGSLLFFKKILKFLFHIKDLNIAPEEKKSSPVLDEG